MAPAGIGAAAQAAVGGLALMAACLLPAGARAGVKYGDAVPAIIGMTDLERIKRALDITHFSVIAAVRLGASEGREAIVSEPVEAPVLKEIEKACKAGDFCPDPVGFLASRIRIILLADQGIEVEMTAEAQVRNSRGRLFDLKDKGVEGTFIAWNGRADEAAGRVALEIVPVTRRAAPGEGAPGTAPAPPPAGETIGTEDQPPFSIRWNGDEGRFQLYDCTLDERGKRRCGFEPEG